MRYFLDKAGTKNNYTDTLITYIDILGFEEEIKNNKCDEIYEIMRNFYNVTSEKEDFMNLIDLQIITFSDTSLRCYKLKKLPFGLLLFEMINIGMIQCHLLFQDTVIRGCIHAGAFFSSDNIFYGPALIDAYNLERKIVTFPMIALSPKISQILEEKESFIDDYDILVGKDYDGILDLLIRKNNLYYINYLKVMIGMIEDRITKHGMILKHKELIKENLLKYSTNPKVIKKCEWLKEYHNTFLKRNLKPGSNQELYI